MNSEFVHSVLIVDDEKNVTKSLGRFFFSKKIQFIAAHSGESALQKIESADAPFSLIISDQRMPGMQGTDLLEQVKAIHPNTIRFLLTAYSDMDTIVQSVNKGSIHQFITKPWDLDALLESIRAGFSQYEKNMESERLLKVAKLQNNKLYDLGCENMETLTVQKEQLTSLDNELKDLESRISDTKEPSLDDFSQQALTLLETIFFTEKPKDLERIHHFFSVSVQEMFNAFEDAANRNGFEMPPVRPGAENG